MLKIVINNKHGGYGLSSHALRLIYDRNPASPAIQVYSKQSESEFARLPKEVWEAYLRDHCTYLGNDVYVCAVAEPSHAIRADATLVTVVEELGRRASGPWAELVVAQASDEWSSIREDEGLERIVD
jgi:hypothetical protein